MHSGHSVLFSLSKVTEFIKVTELVKVTELIRVTEFIRPIGGHELFGAVLLPMSSYCSLFRVRVSVSFCASVLVGKVVVLGWLLCCVVSLVVVWSCLTDISPLARTFRRPLVVDGLCRLGTRA